MFLVKIVSVLIFLAGYNLFAFLWNYLFAHPLYYLFSKSYRDQLFKLGEYVPTEPFTLYLYEFSFLLTVLIISLRLAEIGTKIWPQSIYISSCFLGFNIILDVAKTVFLKTSKKEFPSFPTVPLELELKYPVFDTNTQPNKSRIQTKDIENMSPYELEKYVRDIYAKKYKQAKLTPKQNDKGADVIATKKNGEKWVIQVKHHKNNIGTSAIQEVLGAKEYYQADVAAVATSSDFTKSAKEYADRTGVEIINGEKLSRL